MGDKLMNNPNDDRQNYSLGKSIIYSPKFSPLKTFEIGLVRIKIMRFLKNILLLYFIGKYS